MTRLDLYEVAALDCVDCGEVLPSGLQRTAALRCHDCGDAFAARGVLGELEAQQLGRVADLLERRRQARARLVGAVA